MLRAPPTWREKSMRAGRYGLWVLVGLLVATCLSSELGPAPASVSAIGWGSQVLWLFVALGY